MEASGDTVSPRELRWQLDRLESCLAALRLARSLWVSARLDVLEIDAVIQKYEPQRDSLRTRLAGQPLASRGRTRLPQAERTPYTIFIDECGGHSPPMPGAFPAFCLCALLVDKHTYDEFLVPRWEGLKARFLQSSDGTTLRGRSSITHEPSLRPRNLKHRLRSVPTGPELFEREFSALIEEVDFTVIAAVVRTDDYYRQYSGSQVDRFLPSSVYSLCLDFIMERAVHFLSSGNRSGLGRAVAESRERREDALLQYEYVRLQLEGTQYASDSWFRQQLSPTIEFKTKGENICGLQLVDILARPIAEKVVDPLTPVRRWDAVRAKLYDGEQGRPESYGLKVFPGPVLPAVFA